jgi:RNA polymerase sigma-70 factor (ECF subfamily)
MSEGDASWTSVTLLGRLRNAPKDPAAWSDFAAQYGSKIVRWCRRWGLQESDAHDPLLKLNGPVATFVYDASGGFRAWLKTLTHHAWRDLVAERRRADLAPLAGGGTVGCSASTDPAERRVISGRCANSGQWPVVSGLSVR